MNTLYKFKEDLDLQSQILEGRCDASVLDALAVWRASDPLNDNFWHNLEEHFLCEKAALVGYSVNEELAWDQLSERIGVKEQRVLPKDKSKKVRYMWLSAAAVVVMAFVISTFYGVFSVKSEMLLAQTQNETKLFVLNDGSEITLNGASALNFPKEFNGDKRLVELKGEAFFNVAKNKEKPFIISTNFVEVKVVGTSFSVKSSNLDSSLVRVCVVEGVVEVYSKENRNQKVVLHHGEEAVIDPLKGRFIKNSTFDKNLVAWKTKELSFKRAAMSEVLSVLSDVYKVDFKVSANHIDSYLLTADFNNRDIDFVMKVISTTFNFDYAIENGIVMIK